MVVSEGKTYFVNRWVDCAFAGGLSLGVFVLFSLFQHQISLSSLHVFAAYLTWVINWPHFSATLYRLYGSRDHVSQYPITSYGSPALVLALGALAFAYPEDVAPYLIKLFLIWSPFHYSGQTVGITFLYAKRSGLEFQSIDRKLLKGFVYGSFLFALAGFEVRGSGSYYYGIYYPSLGGPAWIENFVHGGMIACGVGFLLVLAWRCFQQRRWPSPIIILPSLAQFVWFYVASNLAVFGVLVPAFHSLQYLIIAWATQLKDKMDRQSIEPSRLYGLFETLRWGAWNVFGGALLFYVFPRVCEPLGFGLNFCLGVTGAVVQIHHFFVDGVIWKLRSKKVSSPLFVTLEDLCGSSSRNELRNFKPIPVMGS